MSKRIETSKGDIINIEKCNYKCEWCVGVSGVLTHSYRVTFKDNFGGLWCKVQGTWVRGNSFKYGLYEDGLTAVDFK